jgi:dTMP kinase
MGRGILVVFEGIDGAGKSTQVRRLTHSLRELGVPFRVDREPTDGPHGRRLRASATLGRLTAEEELELFILDRKEHVAGFIEPGLAAGEAVILDRYYFSNAAYQGSRGLDWREILRRNECFAPAPDVLLLLDLSIDVSSERIQSRGEGGTEFEKRNVLERCSEIYAQIQHPALRRVDARQSVDLVAQCCLAEVQLALLQRLVPEKHLTAVELMGWVRKWTVLPS